jgi:hypothetical protein
MLQPCFPPLTIDRIVGSVGSLFTKLPEDFEVAIRKVERIWIHC